MASIIADFGVSIITTKDEKETSDLLIGIANREQMERGDFAIRGTKKSLSFRDAQQFVVEGLPNVSSVLAKRLLEHFGSIKGIANASLEDLMEVKGIGKRIASKIIEVIEAEWNENL
jgi:Fanconi anemia group M protein